MKVAIVGASGYTGGELVRLLYHHSSAEVTCVTSRSLAGTPLSEVHPHLRGFSELRFENPAPDAIDADVAFLAVPHTAAMTIAGKLLSRGIKVVESQRQLPVTKGGLRESIWCFSHGLFPCPLRHSRAAP